VGDPDAELQRQRLVEAEARADRGDVVGRGGVAREDGRRIARGEAQQQENEYRDDPEDRDRREDAAGEEADQFFLMFQ
jgi:hypothetical protein